MSVPPADAAAALSNSIDSLLADLKAETDSVKKYKELISEAEKAHTKATGKYSSRDKELKDARRQLKALLKAGKVSKEQQEAAERKLSDIETSLREVDDVRPKTGSIFVRLFLGQVNVKSRFAGDRNTLRDEYEKFKGRTNYAFLTFPTIWLAVHVYLRHVWRYTHWIHILTHVWLLYYYVSLSLRENILKVNGSNIRPWWIYHHYISAVMSIIVLTWPPDSVSWGLFTPQFTAFFWYQGVVQFVQAWYQSRRHYVLRAMGKARSMDVSHSETLTEFHMGLLIIVALVFVAQAWQLTIGVKLLQTLATELHVLDQPWYDFREELQAAMLGVGFIVLGSMNFIVTVQTLVAKSRGSSTGGGTAGVGGAGRRQSITTQQDGGSARASSHSPSRSARSVPTATPVKSGSTGSLAASGGPPESSSTARSGLSIHTPGGSATQDSPASPTGPATLGGTASSVGGGSSSVGGGGLGGAGGPVSSPIGDGTMLGGISYGGYTRQAAASPVSSAAASGVQPRLLSEGAGAVGLKERGGRGVGGGHVVAEGQGQEEGTGPQRPKAE